MSSSCDYGHMVGCTVNRRRQYGFQDTKPSHAGAQLLLSDLCIQENCNDLFTPKSDLCMQAHCNIELTQTFAEYSLLSAANRGPMLTLLVPCQGKSSR